MLDCDQYLTPGSLHEAFDLMEKHDGNFRLVAGATDLLPWARQGRAGNVRIGTLIDISGLPELIGVEQEGGAFRIGANTTFAQFLNNPFLKRSLPVFAKTAVWFADDQIREQATLGGNIVNASPAADSFPALAALNARLVLSSREDGGPREREVSLGEFVLGPGSTCLGPKEILTTIICDAAAGFGSAFEKVGHRRSLVISTVCLAAMVRLDATGTRFEEVRLGLAAVGPVPSRISACEEFLVGKEISPELLWEAANLASDHVASRTRREYRREVLANFIHRALTAAVTDLREHPPAGTLARQEIAHG